MISDAVLNELEILAGKVYTLPWEIELCSGGYMLDGLENVRVVRGSGGFRFRRDAEYALNAANMLPSLITELRQLRQAGSGAREVARAIREMIDVADGDPLEERELDRDALNELVTEIYQHCEYVLDSVPEAGDA